jgi:hypothetical protein
MRSTTIASLIFALLTVGTAANALPTTQTAAAPEIVAPSAPPAPETLTETPSMMVAPEPTVFPSAAPAGSTVPLQGIYYPAPKQERHHWVGMRFSIGVPSGVLLGLDVFPVRWGHLNISGGYAGLGPVIEGSLGVDPIKFPISPIVDVVFGGALPGHVPGVNMPEVRYTYQELLGGLRLGSRNKAGFILEGGGGWLQGSTSGFQQFINANTNTPSSITLGEPSVSAKMFGAARIGFFVAF